MRDSFEDTRAYNIAVITLDHHAAGPVARASVRLAQDYPGLRVTVHAAATWAETPEALAETLRALDPWTIYAAFDRSSNEWERLPTVFQEGVVVPKEPTLSLLADPSKHHDVPLIVGTNRDEAKIFMAFDPRHTRRFAGLPYSLKNPLAYELESRYRA
ncbi:MAG: hypothetical protein EB075_11180, partial [Bacteroidetes bacterium]|nr:hypothetical protein [Bacteroidota bacterium]